MERGERSDPALVPEWYKGSNNGTSGSSSSNNQVGSSSRSDEYGNGHSARKRLSDRGCDRDALRPSAFMDRSSSSFRRSASSNGSLSHDKDGSPHSRLYSSFGRNRRDKDRERGFDLHESERSFLVGNGFSSSDSFTGSRAEKETLRRSHSMGLGRRGEPLPKKLGNDLKDGAVSGFTSISSVIKPFEREFPSLGAEDKHGTPDIVRVSSPGLSTCIQNLTKGTSPLIGADGWTSALAEVPAMAGGNGLLTSSALQTAPVSVPSSAPSGGAGLNMAETLAQAPSRVRTAPQVSFDAQKLEELERMHYQKLIPKTHSMPKTLALNSSDKSKARGARNGDFSGPSKVGQQSSSQLVNLSLRAHARSDASKASQGGNYQVLNRDKIGVSPTAKDGLSITNASRVVTSVSTVSTATIASPKSPITPKLKADSKGGASSSAQSSFGEKRPISQAKDRNDFFNSLRKGKPVNHSTDHSEVSCVALSFSSEKLDGKIMAAATSVSKEDDRSASSSGIECPTENVNGVTRDDGCASEGPDGSLPNIGNDGSSLEPDLVPKSFPDNEDRSSSGPLVPTSSPSNGDETSFSDPIIVPSEEELALLRRLGWDENADGDALTPEEIDDFIRRYEGTLRQGQRENRPLRMLLPDSGQSQVAGSSQLNSSN